MIQLRRETLVPEKIQNSRSRVQFKLFILNEQII